MKKYIYSVYEKIKIAARNLAIKLDAVREHQDDILAVHNGVKSLIGDNKKVADSVSKTIDNLESYDLEKVRSIEDVGGLEELKKDLKETQGIVQEAAENFKAHKEKIKTEANNAIELVQKIDATERSQYQLVLLEEEAQKLEAKVEAYIQEEQLEEKDEKAEQVDNDSPEAVVQECDNKEVCKFELINIADKAGRSLAYSTKPKEEENPEGNSKSSKEEKKEQGRRPKILYVICGEKEGYEEEISIKAEGACKSGAECPQIEFSGEGISKKEVKKINKIALKSEKIIPDNSWADFLRKIIVPDMKQLARPAKYDIKVHECDTPDKVPDLKVIAFPPAGWKGDAFIKYIDKSDKEKKKIKESNEKKGFLEAEALGEWKVGGSMQCYLDKEDWEFKPPETFLEAVQECMNRIAPLFTEVKDSKTSGDMVNVKLVWPNIEFGGGVDLAEHPDCHQLSYDGEIKLKADPFLHVKMDVNILQIMLRILDQTGTFGKFLDEILAKARKGVGSDKVGVKGDIEVMLKAETKIDGELKWKRTASEGKWGVDSANSSIAGSMGVEIYGKVHAEGKVFCVKASAGASIEVKSADGRDMSRFTMTWAALEGADNPTLERQMSYNGLGIYYSAYFELGTDETKAGQAVNSIVKKVARRSSGHRGVNEKQKESENLFDAGKKDELKELCILIDEWESRDESDEIGKTETI